MIKKKKKTEKTQAKKPKRTPKKEAPKSWETRIGREEQGLAQFCKKDDGLLSKWPLMKRIRLTDQYAEAVNGHVLVRINYGEPLGKDLPKGGIFVDPAEIKLTQKETLKYREKAYPGVKIVQVGESSAEMLLSNTQARPISVMFDKTGEDYPTTDNAYPREKPDKMRRISVNFDPKYIRQIADLAIKSGSEDINIELVRYPDPDRQPPASIFRFSNLDRDKQVVCVLMPQMDDI